jgi:hypothetical protein
MPDHIDRTKTRIRIGLFVVSLLLLSLNLLYIHMTKQPGGFYFPLGSVLVVISLFIFYETRRVKKLKHKEKLQDRKQRFSELLTGEPQNIDEINDENKNKKNG